MGRATRWLKGLFGINNKKDPKENSNSSGDHRKDKKGSSFSHLERDTTGLCDDPTTIPPNITPAEAAWLRSFYSESGKEQNKHAIAVAAATAAAADAAVAAAQAAVAVVRLTSQGRRTMFNGSREFWAAVKIQTVFRGCLARKALRALKGLVKLQALVRGYLVRKQAYATLNSMEALIRAQTSVRAQKTRGFILNDENCPLQFQPRNSVEKFGDSRNVCKVSRHSRRFSASSDQMNMKDFDESTKIVEVDTGRSKSRSRRTKTCWISDYGDEFSYSQTALSPLPCRVPASFSTLDGQNLRESKWGITGDECRFSTAQSTPRLANSCGSNAPVTPARSVCVDSYFRNDYENYYYPNYMAKTQSFKAKLRSQSAPKQRPEIGYFKRRLSLNEMMESRNSLSGVRMQRSCSQAQEVISFKNAVMGRLGRSSEFVREQENDYVQRKW